MSADWAYDVAISVILDVMTEITDDAEELVIWRTVLSELREVILSDYRKPQPDLSDLSPLIQHRIEAAVKRQRQRWGRRQLGGRL